MKRGEFIRNLIGLYGVKSLPLELTKEYDKIYLLQFFVRGFQYYEGPKILKDINKNGLVDLVREPKNKYDDCAIAIHFEGIKIGYVPREDNLVLSNIIDANLLNLQAEITHIEPQAAEWENIHVAIFALKEKSTETPNFLTTVEQPEYYTLKKGKDNYQRVFYNETQMMDGDLFYEMMLENSSNDRVFDVIHNTFETPDDLSIAVNESRFIINKNRISNLDVNEIGEKINNQIVAINNTFKEDGYVVCNVQKVASIPDRIERFVEIIDVNGNSFFEVLMK